MPWLVVRNSPILLNCHYPSAEAALVAPRVDFQLRHCVACCFAFNPDYREAAVDYHDHTYNSNQYASAAYCRFIEELAEGLVRRAQLRPTSRILEVACGNGFFLSSLRRHSRGAEVAGFDPQYRGEYGLDAHVIRALFNGAQGVQYDLIVLRHALDQLIQADQVLRDIRAALAPSGLFYVEFLNLAGAMRGGDICQFSHERANYYSVTAMARLLARHGMVVEEAFRVASGEYTGVLARPLSPAPAMDETLARLDAVVRRHQRVVVWGIGARAVSVMTQLGWDESTVAFGADLDPSKQHRYVPVTGQRILTPTEAVAYEPDLVVVANPQYLTEISACFPNPCAFLLLSGEWLPAATTTDSERTGGKSS